MLGLGGARRCVGTYQGKPRENQIKRLIHQLNVYPRLADETMARPIQVMEVHRRMDRSEEGTVQPTTTLRDQFGDLVWHIGHGVGGLDVVKDPGAAAFRDKLPAEDLHNTRG